MNGGMITSQSRDSEAEPPCAAAASDSAGDVIDCMSLSGGADLVDDDDAPAAAQQHEMTNAVTTSQRSVHSRCQCYVTVRSSEPPPWGHEYLRGAGHRKKNC